MNPSLLWISRRAVLLGACLIVLATVVVYENSFRNPFHFDDETSIQENPTIRQLWPIWKALSPPCDGNTVAGRPLLNFTFAINYAISGLNVWSYHATNLIIHILGALLLFGILRRTFLMPSMRDRWGDVANSLAVVIALFWAVHPLQTESVTYIVQRAESLVGLFYLLTLYCFIRGIDSTRSVAWYVAAVAACTLGMASKEVMVSAPLMVLLYDRTFVAGSFREALRRRYGLYLALACTWLLLGWLVISTGNRGTTAGFGAGISSWAYLCTQFGAIVHYLWLCIWPLSLVFDYGIGTARGVLEIVPYAIVVVLLGLATVVALWRWPKAGFLGAWFFAILAPTSSIVPVATQTIAEHRMYLPSAAVLTGIVVGGFYAGRRLVQREAISQRMAQAIGVFLIVFVSIVFGILTFQRNEDYSSGLSIWQDTVAKMPSSARAHNNLGITLVDYDQIDEAIAHYKEAITLQPDYEKAYYNLGTVLAARGQIDEAITCFRKALELKPDYAEAHYNLGVTLVTCGQIEEAIAHYQKAIELKPDYAEAHRSLGTVLFQLGQIDEALVCLQKALEIEPDSAEIHNNIGLALASREQFDDAIAHYQKALQLKPDYAGAYHNLGNILAQQARFSEAIANYHKVLEIKPDFIEAYNNLAMLLAICPDASLRNGAEAVTLAQKAVKLSGGREPIILDTLAAAYAEANRFPEAVQTAHQALDLATQQNNQALAESIKARLLLYETGRPFRGMR